MDRLKNFIKQITSRGSRRTLTWDARGASSRQLALPNDGVVYPAQGMHFHGIRPDGVYVPIVIVDPRGEPGHAEEHLAACRDETMRLRAAGHVVAL